MSNKWTTPVTWIQLLAIVLLVIGIFFRFVNLDRKIYWVDEVYTSLRISGYLHQEMDTELRTGRLVSINDLHKYQYPQPEKSTLDTIDGLIAEESQLSPLYFILVRWWVQIFGNSITVIRSLSVFISLLTFPALYWLCQELFKSRLTSLIALAIVAVSPVHIIYAQEARAYSLWIVMILLSGGALLRSMRLQTRMSWGIYIVTIALGLYTQLFFTFVIIVQGIYLILLERFKVTRRSISYLISVALGFLAFAPWAWIFITHPTPGNLTWANSPQTPIDSAIRWIGIVSRTFVDFGVSPTASLSLKIAVMPMVIGVFGLIVYALYFVVKTTPTQVWLFVITLAASIGLPLMCLDIFLGKRYGTTRYILPSILGIQLAVAYLLSIKVTFIQNHQWHQKIWAAIFCALITIEIASDTVSSQAQVWWNKFPELYQEYPHVASVVNSTDRPLVITDNYITSVQMLGHLFDQKTKLQIVNDRQKIEVAAGFSDIFVFTESKTEVFKNHVQEAYHSDLTLVQPSLWKVNKLK